MPEPPGKDADLKQRLERLAADIVAHRQELQDSRERAARTREEIEIEREERQHRPRSSERPVAN